MVNAPRGSMNDSKDPIRCLHYLTEVQLELGGVVRAAIDMISGVADRGHHVSLITYDARDCPSGWPNASRKDNGLITIQRGRLAGYRFSDSDMNRIRQAVRQCDVVHLHTPWAMGNLKIAKIAQEIGRPYIVTIHGMLDDWSMSQKSLKKRTYLKLAGRKLLENAAFVHCTAKSEMEQSRKWYPGGTPHIVPCMIDLHPYLKLPPVTLAQEKLPALNEPGLKLLFLSRIHIKKGVGRLLEAVGKLTAGGIDIQLFIAGPGDEPYATQMKQLAKDLKIDDRTHFLGMVQDELKLSLYRAADLFVLPTSQENFGLVLPESLLCETSLVTTYCVDIWEELQDAGGIIVQPQSEAVATAIAEATKDMDALKQRGRQGREYVLNWLDPERTVDRFVAMYRQAIG